MNFQISKTPSKREAKHKLEELKKVFLNNQESSAYFYKSFDIDRISNEINQTSSWSSSYPLAYSFYSLKSLISNTDTVVHGGSKFLENYIPPFNATVYKKLKSEYAINVVNSNCDEFGLGATGLNSQYGIIRNPINPDWICGGSSSGSAYLVNKKWVNFAIVSDTGDSSRIPASHCNVYGFKPSYGTISRYGFYPFCSNFDTPSIISNSIQDIFTIFSRISFFDPNDLNTVIVNNKTEEPISITSLNIAVLKETFEDKDENKNLQKKFKKLLKVLKEDANIKIEEVSFDPQLLKLSSLLYRIIAYSESISNYSNLNGLIFPYEKTVMEEKTEYIPIYKKDVKNYPELLWNSRKNLGEEFVFRQLIGMYFLDGENYENIYIKSKKILTLINEKVADIFKKYDLIISPTSNSAPEKISDYIPKYSNVNILNILLLGNFCGLPSISIPWISEKDSIIGLHLMANRNKDNFLLSAVQYIENFLKNKNYGSENLEKK